MQTETLTQLKKQIVSLDDESKKDLAEFLSNEIHQESDSEMIQTSNEERQMQFEWLKENREEYAGKYVALSKDKLVGIGKTLREAKEKAKENGFDKPFVTLVYSENDVPFGGW
jgi:hypothetical protein